MASLFYSYPLYCPDVNDLCSREKCPNQSECKHRVLRDQIKSSHDKEWADMPEFVQEKKSEIRLIVRFRSEEDLQEFAKLINQKLTIKSKSIWYPYKSHWGETRHRWVDES